MEITKYNRGNGKFTIGSQASINANNKNNSSSTTTTTSGSDCELWGNHFDGTKDIEDTLFINGSVYAMPDQYNVDDEDDSNLPEGELETYEPREFEKFEDDNGGNIYAQNLIKSFGDIKAVKDIEGSSTYGKTVYLDYPERKSDESNKTDLLTILKDHEDNISTNETNIKKLQDAKIWGQGIKANNYNIIGNMSDVNDIYFSGDSRTIGMYDSNIKRPNEIFVNKNILVSPYNGNPWEYRTKMKDINNLSVFSSGVLQLHSIVDNDRNGRYYNNPRVLFWCYNPTTLKQEGHWWIGNNWNNGDLDKYDNDGHRDFTIYPDFDNDLEEDELTNDYFQDFNLNIQSTVRAIRFVKNGGTDKQFLMADGSVKELDFSGMAGSGDIPTKVSQLENDAHYITLDDIPQSDINTPVILFSGILMSENADSSSKNYQQFFVASGSYGKHIGVEGLEIKYVNTNVPTLQITVKGKEGYYCRPLSANAMVLKTTDYNPLSTNSSEKRSMGYWCTGGVNTDGIVYINAWRTADNNNDGCIEDSIAWRVSQLNLTIFGRCYKTN